MSARIASVALRALFLSAAGALVAPRAPFAEEPPPAGGGALRMVADPPRLGFAYEEAELRVAAPDAIEELSFTASAGHVEGIRRLAGGGFVARYRPPPERVPQVALVAVTARTARGLEDGWIAIPLSGEGSARVRGEPGSEITLRIGDQSFGPQRVGPDGIAVVPVVVPPGVREGYQGFRPIDLNVPETPLLHAVQDRTSVLADREETVRIVAYLVAPHGAARSGELPVLEPSRGTVTMAEREAGAFAVTWTLPPGPPGEERLAIHVPGAPASRAVLHVEAEAVVPRAGPALLVSARAGAAGDVAGRFTARSGGLVVERPSAGGFALGGADQLAWRLEVEGLDGSPRAALAAVLAGAGVHWGGAGGAELEAAATAGALLAPGRAAPAARLAFSLGLGRSWGAPFVEASLLAARTGAPGAFAALGLSAGVRFHVESTHGNDPDRR